MVKNILIIIILFDFLTINFYPQKKIDVIFRIDDFGKDNTEFYPKLFELFEKYKAKIVLAVVPFYNKSGLTERQKEILKNGLDRGVIEIAQHGYSHEVNLKHGQLINEFLGVPFQIQYDKIRKGKEYLEKELNINIHTFIPPQNQYDKVTVQVLDSLKFNSISAALDEVPECENTKLNFIPYTTTLWNLDWAIKNAKSSNIDHDIVIVVMTHDFEFSENKYFYDNYKAFKEYNIHPESTLNLNIFNSELSFIINKQKLKITTFDNLKIDRSFFKYHRFNSNIENYFLSIPYFLRFSKPGFYPSDDNKFLKYIIYPSLIFLIYLVFGCVVGFYFHKLFKKIISINFRLIISAFILLMITIMILITSLGYLKLLFIGTVIGILLSQLFIDFKLKFESSKL